MHLAAQKACKELPVKVDELLIDIYYYLDKSSKRHHAVRELQTQFGTDMQKILKHVATWWLSLRVYVRALVARNFLISIIEKKEKISIIIEYNRYLKFWK